MNLRDRCALVIGASSGIGEATARELVSRGYTVTVVARRREALEALAGSLNRPDSTPAVHVLASDVTDFDSIPMLFDQAVETMGGLSLVIYAAGVMPKVEPDEYDFSKDRQMIEINLMGMVAWLNQAADYFQRMNRGAIVGIGSVAGDRGRRGNPVYNTSKGAQAIYLEALRNRLSTKGVRVVTIKPGFVATEMTAGMGNLLWMITPQEAARQIVVAAEKKSGTVYVPGRWRFVMWIIRAIPSPIFRNLDI